MSNPAKSSTLMLKLKSEISFRLPSASLSEAIDASGQSLLIDFGSNEKMALKIKSISTAFQNSIGLSQNVWSPMAIQCIEEASLISLAHKAALDLEISKLGLIQERYQNASGSHVALSQFHDDGSVSGSTLVVTLSPDVKHPLSGQ